MPRQAIEANVKGKLREKALKVLAEHHFTEESFIEYVYWMLAASGGVDFIDCSKVPHIPNKKTCRAMRDARNGKNLTTYESLEDLIQAHSGKRHQD